MESFRVETQRRTEFVKIDRQIQQVVSQSGITKGIVHVHVPHTTAGLTINENADPDVVEDMETILERMVPWEGGYAHAEGNAAAHVKASLMGSGLSVLVQDGRLQFGTWQSIYFCEFDGPRNRQVWVSVMAG